MLPRQANFSSCTDNHVSPTIWNRSRTSAQSKIKISTSNPSRVENLFVRIATNELLKHKLPEHLVSLSHRNMDGHVYSRLRFDFTTLQPTLRTILQFNDFRLFPFCRVFFSRPSIHTLCTHSCIHNCILLCNVEVTLIIGEDKKIYVNEQHVAFNAEKCFLFLLSEFFRNIS